MSSVIGLLNRHPTPPQDNESIDLNDVNMSVDNGELNGYYCYMNGFTGYE